MRDIEDVVMPGLVPGIHVFPRRITNDVDGRDKPGHDGEMPEARWRSPTNWSCSDNAT